MIISDKSKEIDSEIFKLKKCIKDNISELKDEDIFSLMVDKLQKIIDISEILRQYFINHPQSIDKYTFLQNSAFTHWVKEKCSKMC